MVLDLQKVGLRCKTLSRATFSLCNMESRTSSRCRETYFEKIDDLRMK